MMSTFSIIELNTLDKDTQLNSMLTMICSIKIIYYLSIYTVLYYINIYQNKQMTVINTMTWILWSVVHHLKKKINAILCLTKYIYCNIITCNNTTWCYILCKMKKTIIDTHVKMSSLVNKTLLNAIKRWLLHVSVKIAHGWPGKKPTKNKCENIIIDITFHRLLTKF